MENKFDVDFINSDISFVIDETKKVHLGESKDNSISNYKFNINSNVWFVSDCGKKVHWGIVKDYSTFIKDSYYVKELDQELKLINSSSLFSSRREAIDSAITNLNSLRSKKSEEIEALKKSFIAINEAIDFFKRML